MFRSATALTAVLLTTPALAHPGHAVDTGTTGWLHYVAHFDHSAPIALAVFALIVGIGIFRHRNTTKTRNDVTKD